jgi:hypothetical protein
MQTESTQRPRRAMPGGEKHYRWQGDAASERAKRKRVVRLFPALGDCERCGHEWLPRDRETEIEPKVCPKCKNPYWNVPRRMLRPGGARPPNGTGGT